MYIYIYTRRGQTLSTKYVQTQVKLKTNPRERETNRQNPKRTVYAPSQKKKQTVYTQ